MMVTPVLTSTEEAFADLRRIAAPLLPLPVLTADAYALGHALFEARSDQRANLTRWLSQLLPTLVPSPSRVLSIGCGDGSVDVELARVLSRFGGPVSYDGIEPNPDCGNVFLRRLSQVRGVTAGISASTFESYLSQGPGTDLSTTSKYDLVLAVHSLYYVPDVADALEAALRLVAPGGKLVVLHAPRGDLNRLVGVLGPSQGQEFSEVVAAALASQRVSLRRERLDATLRLTDADGHEARRVLDFTAQVVIPDELRPAVLSVLDRISEPGAGLRIPHPLDVFVAKVPLD